MEKTILFAGKNLPDGLAFAEGALFASRNVVAAVGEESEAKQAADGETVTIAWNKSSPISARSFVLECENYFKRLDEAILLFDENYLASMFQEIGIDIATQVMDDYILGYQYLATEILSRFEKRREMEIARDENIKPSKLVFVVKSSPDEYDVVKNNSLKNTVSSVANPYVAAAKAAFVSFAENIAAVYSMRDYVSVVLVAGDVSQELCKSDKNLASWLCSYLNEVDALKHRLSPKQSCSWIKPGAKGPGTFAFLK